MNRSLLFVAIAAVAALFLTNQFQIVGASRMDGLPASYVVNRMTGSAWMCMGPRCVPVSYEAVTSQN